MDDDCPQDFRETGACVAIMALAADEDAAPPDMDATFADLAQAGAVCGCAGEWEEYSSPPVFFFW